MHLENLVHRDMKPQNILLVDHSDGLEVKIADFGFSCVYDPEDGLDTNLGSPLYMAPEIILKQKYDSKVDIWAVAVIAYMLISGEPPFPATTKEDLDRMVTKSNPLYDGQGFKKVSSNAKNFLKRGLIKDPKKRPSAAELLEDPWMACHKEHDFPLESEQMKSIFKNLHSFEKETSF